MKGHDADRSAGAWQSAFARLCEVLGSELPIEHAPGARRGEQTRVTGETERTARARKPAESDVNIVSEPPGVHPTCIEPDRKPSAVWAPDQGSWQTPKLQIAHRRAITRPDVCPVLMCDSKAMARQVEGKCADFGGERQNVPRAASYDGLAARRTGPPAGRSSGEDADAAFRKLRVSCNNAVTPN